MNDMTDWKIFLGTGEPHDDLVKRLPEPPPWRDFTQREDVLGSTFQIGPHEKEVVNAALYLRRPILVTGNPGNGKSSLVYAVARELCLGEVLRWPINSRSTLQEGLYHYDAVARLRDANLERLRQEQTGQQPDDVVYEDIGRYIRLGPLGTAMFGGEEVEIEDGSGSKKRVKKPRVLLIDEIDKSDIDLPNDLLHVFEEGKFEIPELMRIAGQGSKTSRVSKVRVLPNDKSTEKDRVEIIEGKIRCDSFPFVVLTSNGERELPPAFLRRCLRLDILDPNFNDLCNIIKAHLKGIDIDKFKEEIEEFNKKREGGSLLATDQLLNAIFIISREHSLTGDERKNVLDIVLRELSRR